ncbi:YadA family autotransporter adhesin [Variovorax rhizosphaerae]|uniref:YadA-like family protein n=1 Tax=Variovorax rhizosphaerae TaxID=1836200 RepID=A0ABU8WNF1_9BURK
MSTVGSTVATAGLGVAAALGAGAAYDPATGKLTAPAFTVYNNDGSAAQAGSVGAAIDTINTQGTKYGQVNSSQAAAQATGADSVALGPQAVASGTSAVAMGFGAMATGTNAVAVGTGALATGSVAIGVNSRAGGGGTAIGDNADAGGTPLSRATAVVQGTAVGFGAVVQVNGGAAIGSGSVASTGPGVPGFVGAGATPAQTAAVAATTSTQGAVAVGDPATGQYRQITGVAAGTTDSDAVNVSQLKATNSDVSQVTNQINLMQSQVAVVQSQVYAVQQNVQNVSRIAYSGVAMGFAMANTSGVPLRPGGSTMGVGIGGYQGYGAVALKYRKLSKDGTWSWGGGVSTTGRFWGLSAGIDWAFE